MNGSACGVLSSLAFQEFSGSEKGMILAPVFLVLRQDLGQLQRPSHNFFISCFFNFIIKGGLFILILHIINQRGLIDPWIWFQVVQFYPSELLWVFQGVLWLQNMNSVLQAIAWLLQPNHIGQEGMTARREKLFDLILFYLILFTLCNPSALSALWSLLLWGHSWRVSFHKPHFSRDLTFKAFPQVRNCLQYYMCM